MESERKHLSVNLPPDLYIELKGLSKATELSMNKIINSILRGYFKARKAKERPREWKS